MQNTEDGNDLEQDSAGRRAEDSAQADDEAAMPLSPRPWNSDGITQPDAGAMPLVPQPWDIEGAMTPTALSPKPPSADMLVPPDPNEPLATITP